MKYRVYTNEIHCVESSMMGHSRSLVRIYIERCRCEQMNPPPIKKPVISQHVELYRIKCVCVSHVIQLLHDIAICMTYDRLQKSHKSPVPYPTRVHISVTKIMHYGIFV